MFLCGTSLNWCHGLNVGLLYGSHSLFCKEWTIRIWLILVFSMGSVATLHHPSSLWFSLRFALSSFRSLLVLLRLVCSRAFREYSDERFVTIGFDYLPTVAYGSSGRRVRRINSQPCDCQ